MCSFIISTTGCPLSKKKMTVSSSVLKVIQQLLTSSFLSSCHFYLPFYLSFNNLFQKAVSTYDVATRSVPAMRIQKQRANTTPYPPAMPANSRTNSNVCTKQDQCNLTSYPEGTWTCTVGTWPRATYFGSKDVTLYFPQFFINSLATNKV